MESLEGFEAAEVVADPVNDRDNEWRTKRSGKLTCSHFDDLMKSGRKESFSQTAITYLNRVAAERMDSAYYGGGSQATAWGTDNESEAVEELRKKFSHWSIDYDSKRFVELTEWIGGSPDGLIDGDACLEIKCPFDPGVHLANVISGIVPEQYYWQCVGHCLVTGRSKTQFVSFDPRLPKRSAFRLAVVELVPTKSELEKLRAKLDDAIQYIQDLFKTLGVVSCEAAEDLRQFDDFRNHVLSFAAGRLQSYPWWSDDVIGRLQSVLEACRVTIEEEWK